MMDRDSGLIPGSWAISASSDCMLYSLGHCIRCHGLREISALEFNKQVRAVLQTPCRAIGKQIGIGQAPQVFDECLYLLGIAPRVPKLPIESKQNTEQRQRLRLMKRCVLY